MAAHDRHAQQLARQLFKLSIVDGAVSADRVAGVLEYVEAHRPANPLMVLRAYRRLIATEVGRGQAVIEHAGSLPDAVVKSIAAAMTKKYSRPVTAVAQPNAALLAGLRVHIGDDVYESSVAGQLSALASAL